MIILFILLYYRNRRYGNEYYDKLENKIEFIEVKHQEKSFDEAVLRAKSELFFKAVGTFKGYEVIYKGLSIEDM